MLKNPVIYFLLYLIFCLILAFIATDLLLLNFTWITIAPHRIVSRLTQIFILISAWQFFKLIKINNFILLGYTTNWENFLFTSTLGWLQGIFILAGLIIILLIFQIRVFEQQSITKLQIIIWITQAFFSGLMISIFEETLFRGALYSAIKNFNGSSAAILWSSLCYASLHFLKPHPIPIGMKFEINSAWLMFTQIFSEALQWKNLDSWSTLVLAGFLLAKVRERTDQIGWCIGLHAGWIFVIQITCHITNGNELSPLLFLTGRYDGIIGWLAVIWLIGVLIGYWWWSNKKLILK